MAKLKPWKKIGNPDIIASKYGRSLILQKFLTNKGEREYSFYHTPKTPSIVFALTADKNVVVIKQFRPGSNGITLELPGGVSNYKNEKPENIAARELLEETGYKPNKLLLLAKHGLWFDPASYTVHVYPFLATECIKISKPKPDGFECLEIIEIPLNKWLRMVITGKIIDLKSVAITHLAIEKLK